MEYIQLTQENLAREHICCAIANEKDVQVSSKKAWLQERLGEGLVFRKGNVRGKCFIEYLPAEYAWAPVAAPGYTFIDCLWVSGQFKGCGYGAELLAACIRDSREKGKKGVAILSSPKKMGFLADAKFLSYKGFVTVDTAEPYFALMALPFDEAAEKPRFLDGARKAIHGDMDKGFTLYYTNQCPFTAKYVPLLAEMAQKRNAPFHPVHIQSGEEARRAPTPFTMFSLFYDGAFITHEILSEKKFDALLTQKGL